MRSRSVSLRSIAAHWYHALTGVTPQSTLLERASLQQAQQRILQGQYHQLYAQRNILPSLRAAELKVYSQNGEDGILLYLLTLLGCGEQAPGRVVELCCGDALECNTTNLIVHHGYGGLLVDGSSRNVARARAFFARHPFTAQRPPRVEQAWLTRESVVSLLRAHGITGDLD